MRYFCIALLLAMSACSTDMSRSTAAPTREDPSKGILCTDETPTGSALRKKVCTTPEQREAHRREAEQLDIRRANGDPR